MKDDLYYFHQTMPELCKDIMHIDTLHLVSNKLVTL